MLLYEYVPLHAARVLLMGQRMAAFRTVPVRARYRGPLSSVWLRPVSQRVDW